MRSKFIFAGGYRKRSTGIAGFCSGEVAALHLRCWETVARWTVADLRKRGLSDLADGDQI